MTYRQSFWQCGGLGMVYPSEIPYLRAAGCPVKAMIEALKHIK